MAKKFHPLDVRYTGPSTAYVGKPKRKHDFVRLDETKPVVLPEPAAPRRPTPAAASGPWGQTAPPPPPPNPARRSPPPLPSYPSATPVRRRSGLRVILILVAIAVIVILSNLLAPMGTTRMIEMPASNRDSFNL